ncbi:hypothetical protein [Flavobacterium fluviatile]|uniref:hypothetical protein n=1 Tax=Flavobacterium fluviatile TaxID=1862387 RepID=UPI0013CF685B|nr:hypothetical protein [Flavobacterium fluviatile]
MEVFQKKTTVCLYIRNSSRNRTRKITICRAAKKYGIQYRKTVVLWLTNFGNFDYENQIPSKGKISRTKDYGACSPVQAFRKTQAFLELQAFAEDKKAVFSIS